MQICLVTYNAHPNVSLQNLLLGKVDNSDTSDDSSDDCDSSTVELPHKEKTPCIDVIVPGISNSTNKKLNTSSSRGTLVEELNT